MDSQKLIHQEFYQLKNYNINLIIKETSLTILIHHQTSSAK